MAEPGASRNALSPLWIIALFLSFSETVLGVAVMKTDGAIQISLTAFVIAFPVLVSAVFFLILWKKPYVYYPPTEFSNEVGVREYVAAMQSQPPPQGKVVSDTAIQNIEAKIASMSELLETTKNPKEQVALILKGTVEAVKNSVIRVDSRPLLGRDGRVWEEPFDPDMPMHRFLDKLWFELRGAEPRIPSYSYGDVWVIRNSNGAILAPAGRQWARKNQTDNDRRPIYELGLRGGTEIEIMTPR